MRRVYSKCIIELDRKLFTYFCNIYDIIVIDLASIVYGIKNPKEFILNLALARNYVKSHFIIILDYLKDKHKQVSDKYVKFIKDLCLDYVLADNESADIKAAKVCREFIDKGLKAIVLSRDYDPLQIIDEILQPVKISEKSWIVRLVRIDRECVDNLLNK